MKRTLTFLGLAVVSLALLPLLAGPAATSDAYVDLSIYGHMESIVPVSGALGADDTDVALIVQHVGDDAVSGTVTVAANGDITFKTGASGSEAADDAFECPVSGALGGVIDVSDSACDTIGEVVDTINGTCTGCDSTEWRAVWLDAERTDSSNDSLLAMSETAATAVNGLNLVWDTDTVGFRSSIALTPYRTMPAYLEGFGVSGQNRFQKNPFINQWAAFLVSNATSTYGTGSSNYRIKSCAVTLLSNGSNSSETCTTLYSVAGGATTANKVFDFTPYGILGRKNEKLLVRLENSAAMASTAHYAYGLTWHYK